MDRKKEEVPRWFVLAANLSLKLHLENSFYALERQACECLNAIRSKTRRILAELV